MKDDPEAEGSGTGGIGDHSEPPNQEPLTTPTAPFQRAYSQLQASAERDRWILERRSSRNVLDPWRPYASMLEQEAGPHGSPVEVATVFLTNRECPFRCLMCDLWQNTLEETVPPGAISAQIRYALEQLPPAGDLPRHLKLYNAGSFFDPRAIPPAEYPEIAPLCSSFERVIVECHPAFVGERLLQFQALLGAQHPTRSTTLEVAMGLETAHPEVLARLNKRMTLPQFRRAAEFLRDAGIALRVFILVRPPWLSETEGLEWAKRSLDFAFECGAAVCALIPTRAGNGAMEALAERGEWSPPSLATLENALDYAHSLQAGRVFVDLWDIERFVECSACGDGRIARLARNNLLQDPGPRIACRQCN